MQSKTISEYAGFDLRSHVLRDRDTWAGSRADVQVSPVKPVTAASGVSGHQWDARKGTVLRVRYYFMHEQHLVTITSETQSAGDLSLDNFNDIVLTLRLDDQVEIAQATE